MGVNINASVYRTKDVIAQVERFNQRTDVEPPAVLLAKIMPEFGAVIGKRFVLIWNEYYDEYNPASEFLDFITRYYGASEDDDFWLEGGATVTGGANADEVASELGINLPDYGDGEPDD